MSTARKLVVLLVVALAGVLVAVAVAGSPAGPRAGEAGAGRPSSPGVEASRDTAVAAPAWLLAEARRLAPSSGDARLDAVYWGTPHDPELGDLTGSGPDDPSQWAYVLVLMGDFPEGNHSRPTADGLTAAPRRMHWLLYVFDDVTHELGVYGEGPGRFDAGAYPSLRRLRP